MQTRAVLFAALGDTTRLSLVTRLADGRAQSIAQLTEGSRLTRQAITKHLRVLERAGVVRQTRHGRERRFAFNPESVEEVQAYLRWVAKRWDDALLRLKSFVETKTPG